MTKLIVAFSKLVNSQGLSVVETFRIIYTMLHYYNKLLTKFWSFFDILMQNEYNIYC